MNNTKSVNHDFEIGHWVHLVDGIGQVLYIREIFVEKYTAEYFEGAEAGKHLYDILICKLLCDYEGKLKKKNRIIASESKYCEPADEKSKKIIESIKVKSPNDYREFLVYDDKIDIGGSVQMEFKVPRESLEGLQREMEIVKESLPGAFTFKEFLSMAKEKKLSLDFGQTQKYVPGAGQNFSIRFFNRLYKTVNGQRIYTNVSFRVRE